MTSRLRLIRRPQLVLRTRRILTRRADTLTARAQILQLAQTKDEGQQIQVFDSILRLPTTLSVRTVRLLSQDSRTVLRGLPTVSRQSILRKQIRQHNQAKQVHPALQVHLHFQKAGSRISTTTLGSTTTSTFQRSQRNGSFPKALPH